MARVILSRLTQAILVMLAVTALAFAMFRFVGDPVQLMTREDASVEEREALRERLGLNDAIWVQYGRFVGRVVQADLGISFRNQREVVDLIAERAPATLELVIVATVLSLAIGIPAGVLCALRPNGVLSRLVQATSLVGISVPDLRDRHAADPGLRG